MIYTIKRFSAFIPENQKEFSKVDYEKEYVSYSIRSIANIIKCFELYKESSNDISHWIEDVGMEIYKWMIKDPKSYGSFYACCALDDSQILTSQLLEEVRKSYRSPEDGIKKAFNKLRTENVKGVLKYPKFAKEGFRYSEKFYVSFFKLLAMVLNNELTLHDIENYLWEIDPRTGKIHGNMHALFNNRREPEPLKSRNLTRRQFENLIYGMIYLVKNQEPVDNKIVLDRFKESIR